MDRLKLKYVGLFAGAIMAEFLLLAFATWNNIVPVFHMILRGPHPGV
jgi:hypothetical protein